MRYWKVLYQIYFESKLEKKGHAEKKAQTKKTIEKLFKMRKTKDLTVIKNAKGN